MVVLLSEVPLETVDAAGKPARVPVVAGSPPNTGVLLEDTVGAWTGLLA